MTLNSGTVGTPEGVLTVEYVMAQVYADVTVPPLFCHNTKYCFFVRVLLSSLHGNVERRPTSTPLVPVPQLTPYPSQRHVKLLMLLCHFQLTSFHLCCAGALASSVP